MSTLNNQRKRLFLLPDQMLVGWFFDFFGNCISQCIFNPFCFMAYPLGDMGSLKWGKFPQRDWCDSLYVCATSVWKWNVLVWCIMHHFVAHTTRVQCNNFSHFYSWRCSCWWCCCRCCCFMAAPNINL